MSEDQIFSFISSKVEFSHFVIVLMITLLPSIIRGVLAWCICLDPNVKTVKIGKTESKIEKYENKISSSQDNGESKTYKLKPNDTESL